MLHATAVLPWPGSKRAVLKSLLAYLPDFRAYHEPFAGSGSVFAALNLRGKRVYLNDATFDVANLFAVMRSETGSKALGDALARIQATIASSDYDYERTRVFFEHLRDELNLRLRSTPGVLHQGQGNASRAAKFVAVCTLAFGGMYRQNKRGVVTSPFRARSSSASSVDKRRQVQAWHEYLARNRVYVSCEDFEEAAKRARRGDLVYLDPPYYRNKATRFASFADRDHERVARVFRRLHDRGCYVMLSSSDHDDIRDMYASFRIQVIPVHRHARQTSNKVRHELLIRNF
jgi:DNA adenine methylase